MSLQGNLFKSVTSWFAPHPSQTVSTQIENPQDEEQRFLASIAHLSLDEQQQRIQRRLMYQRMAQRQGIMEVEYRANAEYDERKW
jgi:hypothetical protein